MSDKLKNAFQSGCVRRWHTNPDLAHTNDRIDAHSGRVARIILMLNPSASAELLRAALIHDDGEIAVGDMKAPLKDSRPDIAKALQEIEDAHLADLWGVIVLNETESRWLKMADRLDAYMWALRHCPQTLESDGWPDSYVWILSESLSLGGLDVARQVSTACGVMGFTQEASK